MNVSTVLDLFAGPGGWDQGLALLGRRDVLGLDIDRDACATATAAGHRRERRDVYGVTPARLDAADDLRVIIGSPPCGGLSSAGLKRGRDDVQTVLDLLDCLVDDHGHTDEARAAALMETADHRSVLMAEPMRYLLALPRVHTLVLEQVPEALPVWEDYAAHLQGAGWWAEVGVLNAADYGVPQDRDRAFLIASSRAPVYLPAPAAERTGPASFLGPGLLGFPRLNDRPDGGKYRARDLRSTDLPSFTVTEKARSWQLVPDDPDLPTRQLTVPEVGRLQSFPADFPWQGTRSSACLQAANAVPPLLAAHVLAAAGLGELTQGAA